MDSTIDMLDASSALDLTNIRYQLIRLEDTITFHLIERAQFPVNAKAYMPGAIKIRGSNLSLFDWIMSEHERLHSLVRRYESPDEYPFFPSVLQPPMLEPLHYPTIIHPNDVSVTRQLKEAYIQTILPSICLRRRERAEQQENYGSAATIDVLALQALSRRIHFGKFVAESKFRTDPDRFVTLIKREDREGIDRAITNEAVEKNVLERLRLKAKTYGTDPDSTNNDPGKIDVEAVVAMYQDVVIPLTKHVEVEYLMQRLRNTNWE